MQTPDDELNRLSARIDRLREAPDASASSMHRSHSYGIRAGVDMAAGVGVGAGAGYLLDQYLGTYPWGLLICLGFGTAAGIRLMLETAKKAMDAADEESARDHDE